MYMYTYIYIYRVMSQVNMQENMCIYIYLSNRLLETRRESPKDSLESPRVSWVSKNLLGLPRDFWRLEESLQETLLSLQESLGSPRDSSLTRVMCVTSRTLAPVLSLPPCLFLPLFFSPSLLLSLSRIEESVYICDWTYFCFPSRPFSLSLSLFLI